MPCIAYRTNGEDWRVSMKAGDWLDDRRLHGGILTMTMTADERVAQREAALAAANEIRIERSAMRSRSTRCREKRAAENSPRGSPTRRASSTTIKVGVLVDWIWGVGKHRARRVSARQHDHPTGRRAGGIDPAGAPAAGFGAARGHLTA